MRTSNMKISPNRARSIATTTHKNPQKTTSPFRISKTSLSFQIPQPLGCKEHLRFYHQNLSIQQSRSSVPQQSPPILCLNLHPQRFNRVPSPHDEEHELQFVLARSIHLPHPAVTILQIERSLSRPCSPNPKFHGQQWREP